MRPLFLAAIVALLAAAPTAVAGRAPERPRVTVETAEPKVTGRTIHVAAGGDLQKAIQEAQPGDRIVLAAGATYRGPFHLPEKDGGGWIVIAGEALPPAGRRVGPALAARMPKLVAAAGSVVIADSGAHHYRLVGLEIAPAAGVFLRHELVRIGEDETDAARLPHHVILDRCYIHGDPKAGARRGVGLNGRHAAVVDSYLADFKEVGADSQAIAGWNGDGPFRIANNYLEGAGENVMFGGADPTIAGMVPADIEITGNHFSKPLRWQAKHASYEGTAWAVKNLFELKNARRVLVDGNVLEYNWPHAQNGFAILFTPRNQDGGSPWSTVEDVTFTNNVVSHVGAGVNILGSDDNQKSEPVRRIAIRNNLFADVGGAWGSGRLFQLLDGTTDVTIDHNTAFHTGSILWGGDHAPHAGFVFQNNIALENEHGIIGSGTEVGGPTLARYFPGASVRRNVIVGGLAARYPPENFFPASLQELGAVDRRDGTYRIALARRFAGAATDGRDPGADLAAIARASNDAGDLLAAVGSIVGHGFGRPAPTVRLKSDATSVWGGLTSGATTVWSGLQSAVATIVASDFSRTLPRAVTSVWGGLQWAATLVWAPLQWAAATGAATIVASDFSRTLPRAIFWLALAILAYIFAGYPIVARIRAALFPDRRVRAPIEPAVTVVVVAYNEEARIGARIENLLALDYPADKLDIVVASDGSTDRTVVEARRYEGDRVAVKPFFVRRGKPAVLSEVVPAARGAIVLLADARQRFDPGAVRALVANFADPAVGVASGELVLSAGGESPHVTKAGAGTAIYWAYEKFIRATESRGGSTVGATGAIYAIRRELFEPIPEDTVLDDVLIPMRAVRKGFRVVFESEARAFDRPSETGRQEFVRKVRTIGGTFQLFARERWLFNPVANRLWFETMSHKALRLAMPLLLTALFVSNAALARESYYGWLMAGQLLFYGAAAFISIPYAIVLLTWATVAGLHRFATGRLSATWERHTIPS